MATVPTGNTACTSDKTEDSSSDGQMQAITFYMITIVFGLSSDGSGQQHQVVTGCGVVHHQQVLRQTTLLSIMQACIMDPSCTCSPQMEG